MNSTSFARTLASIFTSADALSLVRSPDVPLCSVAEPVVPAVVPLVVPLVVPVLPDMLASAPAFESSNWSSMSSMAV